MRSSLDPRRLAAAAAVFAALLPSGALASHSEPVVNLTQRNADDSPLATGATANSLAVELTASSDSQTCDGSSIYWLELEVRLVSQSFQNTPTHTTGNLPGWKPNCVVQQYPFTNTGDLAGGTYKWQARECTNTDSPNCEVTWQQFNGGGTAFSIGPTVDGGGPYEVAEGGSVGLSATGFGNGISYAWDFDGDGQFDDATGATPTFSAASLDGPAAVTISVRVTESDGDTATDTATVNVSNVAPVIGAMNGPGGGDENEELSFSAAGTDAAAADVLSYSWDMGDGGEPVLSSAFQYSFIDPGTYTVTLTLTDDDGGSDTQTLELAVDNVDPTISGFTLPSGFEGDLLALSAGATDPGNATFSFEWDFGDGSPASTELLTSHTWADQGEYAVTFTVADGEGGSALQSGVVGILNAAPVFDFLLGDLSGDEGSLLAWSASASDPGILDVLSYTWNFGDGSPTVDGLFATHSFADDGSYSVQVGVDDGDGGSATATLEVVVANVAPTLQPISVPAANEGEVVILTAFGSDPGDDALSYTWDFGDGSDPVSGSVVSHAWAASGEFTVTVTADDGDGGSTSASAPANIGNAAPVVTSISGAAGLEGEALAFSATASDPGGDPITFSWDFGDGSPAGDGPAVTHSFDDEGTYVVTVTADDGEGGQASASLSVVVVNANPTGSLSLGTGDEDTAIPLSVSFSDPGPNDSVTATWDFGDGSPQVQGVSLTHVWEDAGSWPVTVLLSDEDGGATVLAGTVAVATTDADADGLLDAWELENGFDPTDPSDGAPDADADGDGISNLDEQAMGSDPQSYDGPGVPSAVSPVDYSVVASAQPQLVVSNAADPQGDPLVYDFEIYADAALTALVGLELGLAEGGSGQTSWTVESALQQDTGYWWRARAADPYVAGAWTEAEGFFVDSVNEPPTDPEPIYPLGGEVVTATSPLFQWTLSADAEGAEITYDFELLDGITGEPLEEVSGIVVDALELQGELSLSEPLTEDTRYAWTIVATDAAGNSSAVSDPAFFVVSLDDAAPSPPLWVAPENGGQVGTLSPALIVGGSLDPELGPVTYWFEAGPQDEPGGDDWIEWSVDGGSDGDDTIWDLDLSGHALPEDRWIDARVQATDAAGNGSPWEAIAFFVSAVNDPPGVPAPISPADGAESAEPRPVLVVGNALDPEGAAVRYEFLVAANASTSAILLESGLIPEGAGPSGGDTTTSWQPEADLPAEGALYWAARAVDGDGAASDWSPIWTILRPRALGDDDDGDDGDAADDDGGGTGGCEDCQESVAGRGRAAGSTALAGLALGLALGVRRRPQSR